MQRTVTDAARALEELAPTLNPEMYRRYNEELTQARNAATATAGEFADRQVADVDAVREDLLRGLCEVRDAYAALAKDGESGRISAADYQARFARLRQQQRALERRAGDIVRVAELVEGIETDPEGWADNFQNRYPHARPNFSF